MNQKTIALIIRLSRFIRGFTLFYIGLLVFGVVAAGPGDGLNPKYAIQFTMLVVAVIVVFALSYLIPWFLRKKWPQDARDAEGNVKVTSASIILRHVTWIFVAIAVVMGLSILLVSRSW